MLTGVDSDSTYCFLLEAVEHRDEDTWGWYLLEAETQGLNPDYTIADAGVGIRAGQKAAWGNIPCHGGNRSFPPPKKQAKIGTKCDRHVHSLTTNRKWWWSKTFSSLSQNLSDVNPRINISQTTSFDDT